MKYEDRVLRRVTIPNFDYRPQITAEQIQEPVKKKSRIEKLRTWLLWKMIILLARWEKHRG